MSVSMFDKESKITTSDVYFSYVVLSLLDKRKQKSISFFKLAKEIKNVDPEADEKQLFFGMMLLFSLGIIQMDEHELRIISS